jgi:hypothetical protein
MGTVIYFKNNFRDHIWANREKILEIKYWPDKFRLKKTISRRDGPWKPRILLIEYLYLFHFKKVNLKKTFEPVRE